MSKVIIAGHGGYGTAIKNCLGMLLGETEGMFYVDFNIEDNLETLNKKLIDTMKLCGDEQIVFACDLTGGSPFRQCAMICVENSQHITVAGLNVAAYAEMFYNQELSATKLTDLAVETAQASILRFPD